ncbi:MAG: hypothetical protein K0V04_44445 [Deltaproteobacteria bacterium]|nr:hypothetical protein [Deltaproteobacteria bacterium]
MKRLAGSVALALCVSSAFACDSGEKKDAKKADAKKADAKKADAKKADDAKQAGGDAKAEATPAAPVKLAALSLEDAGLEGTLQAPEGAKASAEFGAFVVNAGESFQLEIHSSAADLAARKKEIEGNTVNKLKSFVTENETELVYETEVMGKSEFHFLANIKVDDASYNCEDKKGPVYAKADVDAMLAACKSLKPNE